MSASKWPRRYRRFGSRVTVIEPGPTIISREDADAADAVQRLLSDEGVGFLVSTQVLKVDGESGKKVTVTVRSAAGEQTIEGSDILVAAGRVPNTAGIGLEKAGIELDDRGYIRVNERLETTAPDVWAIGECAGSPQFTHVSVDDFRIVSDNLAGGKSQHARSTGALLPVHRSAARACRPERTRGRSAQGIAVRVARLPMSAVLRTRRPTKRKAS